MKYAFRGSRDVDTDASSLDASSSSPLSRRASIIFCIAASVLGYVVIYSAARIVTRTLFGI